MAFIVGPALRSVGAENAPLTRAIAEKSHRYYAAAGGLAILSGLTLTWLEGRFSSPLILAVIVLAVFLAFWGARVSGQRLDVLAQATADARPAAAASFMQASTVEIAGLIVAFTLMILVRFGYS